MSTLRRVLLVALTIITASCASQPSLEGNAGIVREYNAPLSSLTAAARHSVEALNVTVTNVYESGGTYFIQFKKPASAWSWGELGLVKVYSSGSDMATVEVISQKVHRAQVTGTEQDEFASAIFAGIDTALTDLSGD